MAGLGKPTATALASAIAACAICMSTAASAYAFMHAGSSVSNEFSVLSCSVAIVEDFDVPEKLSPGSRIVKNVKFENTGTGSCFMRAHVAFDRESTGTWARISFNEQDWAASDDGYRYCTAPVAQGGLSPSVCTEVAIDESASEDDIESFDVLVTVDAVPAQSGDGAVYRTPQEAFAAAGR